jgi:hypothetical protein
MLYILVMSSYFVHDNVMKRTLAKKQFKKKKKKMET